MKKFYVLAAATMLAASASAANAPQKKSASVNVPAKAQVTANMKAERFVGTAAEANHSAAARKAARKAQPVLGEAFYKRPAGSLYGSLTSESYLLYNPYVSAKPYAPTVFEATQADAYNWRAQLYNMEKKGREWLTVTGMPSISVEYAYETDSVPSLSNGVTEFHIGGTNKDGSAGWSTIAAIPDLYDWTYDETSGFVLFSPKFFAKRDGQQYSTRSFTGAKDAEGGTSGHWFGHNYSGWNAMGTYVEKPCNPYLLRSVQVMYHALELANDATIYVDVYKVAERNNPDNEKFDCVPGDLIAHGSYTFVKGEAAEEGVAEVPFVVEEGGLEYEITPTIDDEILIVVSGYDSEDFVSFTMSISADEWDEGYGQHGYMMHDNGDGTYGACYGLDGFFTSSLGYVAPTVFLDIVNPFLLFNYNIEDGVRAFDKEGNCTTVFPVSDYPYEKNVISLYSFTSSEEMTFTLEDGSDLPEWLTINAQDDEDEEGFTGEVLLTVNCAANAGAPREAKVKCEIPGGYVVLSISQDGEGAPEVKGDVNGDGVVDIADVNAAIDMVLGLADNKPAADVNGDGVVDIADINAIIDIVLGL